MEKPNLLLVDDEERFLTTTQKLLEKRGYTAYTARNSAEAMAQLNSQLVHVVILDVKMPGKDGNIILKEIRSQFPLVEVIILTGHATVESAVDGLKAGATDYLTKPIDIDELVSKAEEAFEKRRRLEEKIRSVQFKSPMKNAFRTIMKQTSGSA